MNDLSCSSISTYTTYYLEINSNTLSLVMKVARDNNKDIILKKILCSKSENIENEFRQFKRTLLEKVLLAQQG